MTDFIKENLFSILLCIMNIILIILYVSNNIKLTKLRKSYKDFMIRLGRRYRKAKFRNSRVC